MMTPFERAKKDIGTWEWKGKNHNPKVLQYFKDVGHDWVTDDETAWCAAFVGAMLERGGVESTKALNARSYLDWGEEVSLEDARPGDIVVFERGDSSWQGHVGFFVKENPKTISVLSGNQVNQVNTKNYSKRKLLGVRRYDVPKPATPKSKWQGLLEILLSIFKRKRA